jgi:hypothetical protein
MSSDGDDDGVKGTLQPLGKKRERLGDDDAKVGLAWRTWMTEVTKRLDGPITERGNEH